MKYCYVQNNAIVDGPRNLPESDASRSNLAHSTNNLTHVLGPPDIVILPTSVIITDTTVALDQPSVDANIAEKKVQLSIDIKGEAGKRISIIVPSWQQSNLNARMNELNKKVAIDNMTLIQSELDEIAAMDAIWTAAKNIRSKSDALENLVAGMTATQLDLLDVTDDSHWV